MIRANTDPTDLSVLGTRWCITDASKQPKDGGGRALKVTAPSTWMTYAAACVACDSACGQTLGVLLDPNTNLHCIDFDKCIGGDGTITDPEIERFVTKTQSYTEISMSGTGLHVFVRGSVDQKLPSRGCPEVYNGDAARYIAVTGNVFEGLDTITENSGAIAAAVEMNASRQPELPTKNRPQTVTVADELKAVTLCLQLIKPLRCSDRNEWLKVGCAIKNTLDDDAIAFEIFDDWSKGSDHYEEMENIHQWNSIQDPQCELGTLIYMAKIDSGIHVAIQEELQHEREAGPSLMQMLNENMFTLDAIPDDEQVEWMAEGVIAKGHHTLLSGREKSGKSTLLGGLLKALTDDGNGEFLGQRVRGNQKIMILSEESKAQWRQRREQLNIGGEIHISSNPFARTTQQQWKQFCEKLGNFLSEENFDLLILDPLANFAPWSSENDAPEVTQAMTSLSAIKKRGIAILSCHHAAKYSGESRGSTALTSNPDICLTLKYTRRGSGKDQVDATDSDDRILNGKGRFPEVPKRLLVTYDWFTHSYALRDSVQKIQRDESTQRVLEAIRNHDGPISKADLKRAIGHDLSESTVQRRLKDLENKGLIIKTGEGEVGNPYMYELCCQEDF